RVLMRITYTRLWIVTSSEFENRENYHHDGKTLRWLAHLSPSRPPGLESAGRWSLNRWHEVPRWHNHQFPADLQPGGCEASHGSESQPTPSHPGIAESPASACRSEPGSTGPAEDSRPLRAAFPQSHHQPRQSQHE